MSDSIAFGTDGWRAVIADQFTFDNVRRVADAIAVAARTLRAAGRRSTRTRSSSASTAVFSRASSPRVVAESLRAAGFRVILSDRPTPSQTISFTARHRSVLGGVVVTASHNPAKYNGIKFKAWYGGSALPEMYEAIAASIGKRDAREGGIDRRGEHPRRLRRRRCAASSICRC